MAYIVSSLLVAATVTVLWFATDRASTRVHIELAERNRALRVELARNAMEESFVRLIQVNQILVSHSFPEFERGARSRAAMMALLDSEMDSYGEILVYGYFRKTGQPVFVSARPGTDSVTGELGQTVATLWGSFKVGDGPVVLASPSSDPEPYFMVVQPVFVDGVLTGLLGNAIGLSRAIEKYLVPLASGEGNRSFLMFGAGRILWASDDLNPTLFALDDGSLMTSRSFMLGNGEFTIIADELRASLLADIHDIEAPRIIVLLTGVLLLATALVSSNYLYMEKRKRLALADEERRLSERVAIREHELQESEIRFRKLFEGANDGILILNENGSVIECNAQATVLFGRDMAFLIGRKPEDLSPLNQPDGRSSGKAARAVLDRVRTSGSHLFEWSHLRGDGTAFDAEISISLLQLGDRSMYQAVIRDVSERKRNDHMLREALEDREILLRELHHRVKNNFQFLESLIELQKGGETAEIRTALSKIQSRTSALAAAYLITAENPETLRVDVSEYLNVLSSQVVDSSVVGTRFDVIVDCEDIPLSLDSAVSLGLLFRELLTNAIHHGYGEDTGGRIDVSFVRHGNEAVLGVRDYGKGLPAENGEHLGLTIVRALVSQLNGTFSIASADPGTFAEARFPLS